MAVRYRIREDFSRPARPFPLTRNLLRNTWVWGEDTLALFGRMVWNLKDAARWLMTGQLHRRQWVAQMGFIGWDALWMAMILVVFSGMVIAIQVAEEMVKQGGEGYVGALISMAILREMAPVMTAVALIAVVGTTYASELTSMNNSEETQALRMMHVSPSRYLITPRLMGCVVITPLLTFVTGVAAVWVAMWICLWTAEVQPAVYLNSVWQFTDMKDLFNLFAKGAAFGSIVALVATTIGLNTKGGAKEVGDATTKAVVAGFVLVAIADYVLTYVIYGANN